MDRPQENWRFLNFEKGDTMNLTLKQRWSGRRKKSVQRGNTVGNDVTKKKTSVPVRFFKMKWDIG